MAITHNNTASGSNAATTSHAITYATTADGDVLTAEWGWNGSPGAITPPSGWTVLVADITGASNPHQAVYYKIWHTGDPTSDNWTTGSSVADGHGSSSYTGCDQTTPIDVAASSNFDAVAGLTATALGVTTVTDGAMLIGGAAANSSTVTFTTTDLDERFDAGAGKATTGADRIQTTAGASGNKAFTISASRAWTAWLSALRPSGGGPTLITASDSIVATEVTTDLTILSTSTETITATESSSPPVIGSDGACWISNKLL